VEICNLKMKNEKKKTTTNFGVEKCQAFVDVFDLVYSHLAIVGLGQFLARDDLQELEEFLAVGKVHKQVFHLHTSLRAMHHHRRPEEMQTQPSIKQKALEGGIKIHTHTDGRLQFSQSVKCFIQQKNLIAIPKNITNESKHKKYIQIGMECRAKSITCHDQEK
jgi:hypothetical protein